MRARRHTTTVTDLSDATLGRARSQLHARLDRDAAAAGADLVIEAAVEKLDVKREVFARLDKVAPPTRATCPAEPSRSWSSAATWVARREGLLHLPGGPRGSPPHGHGGGAHLRGTDNIQALLVGRDITGISTFS